MPEPSPFKKLRKYLFLILFLACWRCEHNSYRNYYAIYNYIAVQTRNILLFEICPVSWISTVFLGFLPFLYYLDGSIYSERAPIDPKTTCCLIFPNVPSIPHTSPSNGKKERQGAGDQWPLPLRVAPSSSIIFCTLLELTLKRCQKKTPSPINNPQ